LWFPRSELREPTGKKLEESKRILLDNSDEATKSKKGKERAGVATYISSGEDFDDDDDDDDDDDEFQDDELDLN